MLKFLCQENELFIKSWTTAVFLLFLQFLFSYRCALTHTHTGLSDRNECLKEQEANYPPAHGFPLSGCLPCTLWLIVLFGHVCWELLPLSSQEKQRQVNTWRQQSAALVSGETDPSLLHSSSSASMICCCYDCYVSVLASCVFLLAWLILFMMEEFIKEESTFPLMTTQNVCRDLAIEEIIAGWRCLLPARFYWYWTNNFLVWLLCE